jgi:heme ABC exporter ATP-binding subunit CcmA
VVQLGRFPALAGVDLDVDAGEILLVRGPNGAGKSTLLRTCAGLLRLSAGAATVVGCDLVRERRSVRSHVGLLGHATGLYDELTVRDNVQFWARAAGATVADADAALRRVAVDERTLDLPVQRLSAGQRRRTSLACLVARRPRLWLLDEPHAGLDHDARDLVDALMREATAAGATVLFASHELDRAEAVATRTVTLAAGRVLDGAANADASHNVEVSHVG